MDLMIDQSLVSVSCTPAQVALLADKTLLHCYTVGTLSCLSPHGPDRQLPGTSSTVFLLHCYK